jgi:hypothetical protein
MEDNSKKVEETKVKAKPGPKPKAKPEPKPEPAKLVIKEKLESKDGLWVVESERAPHWIIIPTKANTKAFGRFAVTEERLMELFA